MARELLKPDYLGEGIYVHDESHGLQIAVNHHENKVAYLEPSVIIGLVKYAQRANLITEVEIKKV